MNFDKLSIAIYSSMATASFLIAANSFSSGEKSDGFLFGINAIFWFVTTVVCCAKGEKYGN
jgi:hypothetical protein